MSLTMSDAFTKEPLPAAPVPIEESRRSGGLLSGTGKTLSPPAKVYHRARGWAQGLWASIKAEWTILLFVWGIWLLLLVGALTFVLTYGSYVPFMDEWEMVPVLTGEQRVTLDWLWTQDSESRVPLPRVLLLALYRLSGGDFHIGLVVNVVVVGALSLAMIRLARRLRGRTSYLDAFFPLVLFNLDQEIVFLGLGINVITSTALAGVVLLLIIRHGQQCGLGNMLLAGTCLVLLTLSGSTGAVLVPALAVWLGYVAVAHWLSGGARGRRDALVLGALTLAAMLVFCLYISGFQRNPSRDGAERSDLWSVLRTSLQFLSLSFGQSVAHFLFEYPSPPLFGGGVLLLTLLSAALLVRVCRNQPLERPRALGLLMFLGAMGCLALVIGLERTARGTDAGYAPRYVTLAVPVLYCLYFVWELYGSANISRLIHMVLFTLICMFSPLSWQQTLQKGEEHGKEMAEVEGEIAAKTSPAAIAERHVAFLYNSNPPEALAEFLRMLQRAGVGPFGDLRADPVFGEIRVPVEPITMNQMTWKDGVGRGSGDDPYLVFALPQMQYVQAMRLKYAYEDTASPALFQLFWRRSDGDDFAEERSVRLDLDTGPGEKTTTILIGEKLDQIRIDPDMKPCVFRLSEIVLLVAEPSQKAPELLIEGRFELITKDQIAGWAWDKKQPDRPVTVEFYDGERLMGTVAADQFRQDLAGAGIGNGKHAFYYPTPAVLRDGKAHTVRTKASGHELHLSPQVFAFPEEAPSKK
jgi:hypothetical protein